METRKGRGRERKGDFELNAPLTDVLRFGLYNEEVEIVGGGRTRRARRIDLAIKNTRQCHGCA